MPYGGIVIVLDEMTHLIIQFSPFHSSAQKDGEDVCATFRRFSSC